jgi:hypothetical protein
VSNNASAVKTHNATSNVERFENKNNFFYFEKRTSQLGTYIQRCRCSCKFRSRAIGPLLGLHTADVPWVIDNTMAGVGDLSFFSTLVCLYNL